MENIATIKNTMGAYTTKAKTDKLKTEKGKVGEVNGQGEGYQRVGNMHSYEI